MSIPDLLTSISVGSAEKIRVVGQPRTTGDGYYESLVLTPDGKTYLREFDRAIDSSCGESGLGILV